MYRHFCRFRILGIGMFVVMIAVFSVAAMLLWNALMPDIFGLPALNYWQTAGLVVLARILFGGLGYRGHGFKKHAGDDHLFYQRNALRKKWMKMNDEERNEFMRSHRGLSHLRDFFDEAEKPDEKDSGGGNGDGR